MKIVKAQFKKLTLSGIFVKVLVFPLIARGEGELLSKMPRFLNTFFHAWNSNIPLIDNERNSSIFFPGKNVYFHLFISEF